MTPELQTVIDLISANGGVMEYADIHSHPSVQSFNHKLDSVKRDGKRLGVLNTLPLAKNDAGNWVARWEVVNS